MLQMPHFVLRFLSCDFTDRAVSNVCPMSKQSLPKLHAAAARRGRGHARVQVLGRDAAVSVRWCRRHVPRPLDGRALRSGWNTNMPYFACRESPCSPCMQGSPERLLLSKFRAWCFRARLLASVCAASRALSMRKMTTTAMKLTTGFALMVTCEVVRGQGDDIDAAARVKNECVSRGRDALLTRPQRRWR